MSRFLNYRSLIADAIMGRPIVDMKGAELGRVDGMLMERSGNRHYVASGNVYFPWRCMYPADQSVVFFTIQ